MTVARAALALVAASVLAVACGGDTDLDDASEPDATATSTAQPAQPDPGADAIAIPGLKDEPASQLVVAADPSDIALPTVDGGRATSTTTPSASTTTEAGATTTTAAGTPTTVPSSSTSTTATSAPPNQGPPSFPPSMAAIHGGNEILLIDTSTGSSTAIAEFSLIVDEENQVGPQSPFSVDVDPVAVGVRYDTCCDPQSSVTSLIDLVSGTTGTAVGGALPSISADGSKLALTHLETVSIVDTSTSAETTLARSDAQWFVGRTSWSPDGSRLAVEVHSTAFGAPVVAVVDANATSLDGALVLGSESGLAWTMPSFRADGALILLEAPLAGGAAGPRVVAVDLSGAIVDTIGLVDIEGVLDIDHDVSGHWLLVVDSEGEAFWFGPDGAGRLPGGGYTSASW